LRAISSSRSRVGFATVATTAGTTLRVLRFVNGRTSWASDTPFAFKASIKAFAASSSGTLPATGAPPTEPNT
jgi:hypothetical protein